MKYQQQIDLSDREALFIFEKLFRSNWNGPTKYDSTPCDLDADWKHKINFNLPQRAPLDDKRDFINIRLNDGTLALGNDDFNNFNCRTVLKSLIDESAFNWISSKRCSCWLLCQLSNDKFYQLHSILTDASAYLNVQFCIDQSNHNYQRKIHTLHRYEKKWCDVPRAQEAETWINSLEGDDSNLDIIWELLGKCLPNSPLASGYYSVLDKLESELISDKLLAFFDTLNESQDSYKNILTKLKSIYKLEIENKKKLTVTMKVEDINKLKSIAKNQKKLVGELISDLLLTRS